MLDGEYHGISMDWWCGSIMVMGQIGDQKVPGLTRARSTFTHVFFFAKQYNLVPAKGR